MLRLQANWIQSITDDLESTGDTGTQGWIRGDWLSTSDSCSGRPKSNKSVSADGLCMKRFADIPEWTLAIVFSRNEMSERNSEGEKEMKS
jgi:hypothetical protein